MHIFIYSHILIHNHTRIAH